jgi:tyrosine-protein kinase Etk/Wzc
MENYFQNVPPNNLNNTNSEVKEVIYKYLRYWPWFLMGVVACLLIAFLYLRYATPVYRISSKILIKGDDKGGAGSTGDVLDQLDVFNIKNNIYNEQQVIQTKYLMRKVVDELNLNISYFVKGSFKAMEVYQNCPFRVNVLSLMNNFPAQQFELQIQKAGLAFHLSSNGINGDFHFGDTIRNSLITFVVEKQPFFTDKERDYTVMIQTPESITIKYYAALKTDFATKNADVIQLSIAETVPEKGEYILNKLYEVYTRVNLEDKKRILDSTISFIDNRLSIVANELSGVENNIEHFKTSNRISVDLQEQARLAMTNASDIQKQQVQQEVQIGVIKTLEDHIRKNAGRVVPNASEINDPTYISTVEKYNNLVLERDRQLQTTKPDNPLIGNLNSQIEILRKDLVTSLENIKKGMGIARNELEKQNRQLTKDILSTPSKERTFLDITRQQEVKQQLFLYLLQKREETAIAKSGTLSNSILIEPAKSDSQPFSPNKRFIYLLALLAGLLIPGSILFGFEFFDSKVRERKDITTITQVPVLGEIGHNNNLEFLVARQGARTALSEQFRSIRANLHFILKGESNKAIMVTSSMNGEGKSFFSVNLALCLATSGKKVVLVELDLRKPRLSRELGLKNDENFTAYMTSRVDIECIAKPTSIHPQLFLVSSGPIPTNPAELLSQDKMRELFEHLKAQFDYIIVDTPPLGLVSDGLLIGRYTDACIYVIRQDYTLKQQLDILNDLSAYSKVPNPSILINDVKVASWLGYGKKYNSNGFYTEEEIARIKVRQSRRKVQA